jgi:hypothetical protein
MPVIDPMSRLGTFHQTSPGNGHSREPSQRRHGARGQPAASNYKKESLPCSLA